ncbi:VQ motif-containing protein [Euphorbia peplus]|nr:VQ motif-containing protein [Euphorbia peplus]
MSPAPKLDLNGPRPCALKLNRESHLIHKPKRNHPVIIYTHSPKVIHAAPTDFMALVQRLTGLSSSDDQRITKPKDGKEVSDFSINDDDHKSTCLVDNIPLFTPNSMDLFCSPTKLNLNWYRYRDSL